MNVDALVKLYYVGLAVSTLVAAVLAVIARRQAVRSGEENRLILVGPVVAAVIAVGFFALLSGIGFNSSPRSCINCHEMNPEYNAWRRSAHARVTCLACHLQADGAAGLLVEEAIVLKEVWQHFTGSYPSIINRNSDLSQKEMTSAVCERCHDERRLGEAAFGRRVRVDHRPHIRLGITCQHCHNRIAHQGARGFNYLDGLRMMDGCMRCHAPGPDVDLVKGRRAPSACSTCHPKNWARIVFGKSSPTAADFDRCRDCHRISDPGVVDGFAKSKMAEALDCSDCHGNHDDKFVADPDPTKCNQCHTALAAKVVDGTHGGKEIKRLKPAPKKPAQVRCTPCHSPHRFAVD